MTVYVIPDNENMSRVTCRELQEELQAQHEDKVIVLPPRSLVILDRPQRLQCPHCGGRFDQ